MAYVCTNSKGEQYYLHAKTVTFQNGNLMPVYYFRREPKPTDVMDVLPEGYRTEEKHTTRLPYLQRAAS